MARDDGHRVVRSGALATGAAVQVRTRFDGCWASGFDVAEVVATNEAEPLYRVRRALDGSVLPVLFSADDLIEDSEARFR
ncbi:MAG: hypothetical protein ACT4OV_12550 [Microthrixaceae bacterium]